MDEPIQTVDPSSADSESLEINSLANGGEAQTDVRWKNFKLIVKDVADDGTFNGYASVWGVIDSDSEVCDKGCTTRSLKNNPNFVLLWQHDTKQPIGFALEASEDERGLKIKGQLALDCEKGQHAYAMLKLAKKVGGTAKMGLSIGFRALSKRYMEDPRTKKTHLHFTEIALLETSIVTFPANPDAWVNSVKSQFLEHQEEHDTMRLSDEQIPALAKALVEVLDQTKQPATGQKADNMTEDKAKKVPADSGNPDDYSFNASLQHAQTQSDLWRDKSNIEDALYSTLSKIHGSELADGDFEKAVGNCFDQYGKAMTGIHTRMRALKAAKKETDISGLISKSAAEPAETKKGKSISAANKKKLLAAHADMQDALDRQAAVHKSMFDGGAEDDGAASAQASDEVGQMSDSESIEGKEANASEKSEVTEAKSETPVVDTAQPASDSDSGTHSLFEELATLTKSRLEQFK